MFCQEAPDLGTMADSKQMIPWMKPAPIATEYSNQIINDIHVRLDSPVVYIR